MKLKLGHYQFFMFNINELMNLPDIMWGTNTFKAIFVPAVSFSDATHFDPPHFRLEAQSQEFPPG